MEDIRKPLLVDSLAAVAGGAARPPRRRPTSSRRPASASAARTGWVAVVAGALFFPFMFFAPIIGMVPPQATAPALILVGFLMMTALTEAEEDAEGVQDGRKLAGIDFTDLGVGLGAALTIMIMPFTFSITDGIGMGFLAFMVVRAAQGRRRTCTRSCGSPRRRSSSTSSSRSCRTRSTGSSHRLIRSPGWQLAFLPATEQARLVRERRGLAGRARRALPRADRAARPGARRVRHGLRRRGARRRAREGDAAADAPFHGVPIPLKDLDTTAGIRTTFSSARSPTTSPTSTSRTSPAAAGRRVRHPRQDEHARVRDDGVHRLRAERPLPHAVGPVAGTPAARAAARRPRSRPGSAPIAQGSRRRRLDPHPRLVLRPLRLQGLARPGLERAVRAGHRASAPPGPLARTIARRRGATSTS